MTIEPALLQQCWFLAGPTASGKTATGIELAAALNAEILSLDSMAIYREMDIGTAKPTPAEQKKIPHHLIDLIDPHEEFSTADYLQHAEQKIRDLLSRKKIPLFVGGTGLYLRSLLRGFFEGPAADWELRTRLEHQEAQQPGSLHQQLTLCDPVTAQRLHPHDQRRLIRAIEVFQLTGHPLSELHRETELPPDQRPKYVYWLHPERDWLHERINRRVNLMLEAGLVAEVEHLLQRQPPPSRTALQGLGYKEVVDYLQGHSTAAEMAETIKTRTRQFAKRQHTWFRNLSECQEIPLSSDITAQQLAAQILHQSR